MVGLKNWLKSSRILQFLSKLVLQNNLIAHYCFFKQITEMSICHCLSVKKRVSVKNVKILEMSDFGNTDFFLLLGSHQFVVSMGRKGYNKQNRISERNDSDTASSSICR